MDLVEGDIVDGGFGLAEEFEGTEREGACLGRERRSVEDLANGRQVTAVLVRMLLLVPVRLLVRVRMIVRVGMVVRGVMAVVIVGCLGIVAIDEHACLAGCDAAAIYRIEDEGCA